jgi:hypothetical protein
MDIVTAFIPGDIYGSYVREIIKLGDGLGEPTAR